MGLTRRYLLGLGITASLLFLTVGVWGAEVKPQQKKTSPPSVSRKPVQPASKGRPSLSPSEVVRTFLRLRDAGQAEKTYQMLSKETQKRISLNDWKERAQQVRTSFGAVLAVAGEALLIGGGEVQKTTVGKPTTKGNKIVFPVRQIVEISTPVTLVKEEGQWKVDLTSTFGVGEVTPAQTGASETKKTSSPSPSSPSSPPATPPSPPPDTTPQCRGNVRALVNALMVYALDHEGRLPKAETWLDDIQKYLSGSPLTCPSATGHTTSYAFNKRLSEVRLVDILNQSQVVLIYETAGGPRNDAGEGANIPKPGRHEDRYVVAYADGNIELRSSSDPLPNFQPQLR